MGEESVESDKKKPKVTDVPKKPRGRKKLQYQTLKKQMEFYFSAANLSKDRFLGQLLKESEYVDLNVFLKFNKIRSLTSNIKDIVNALQSSDLLKLTECGTKVYRTKPLESKSNSEECTIYVENIPARTEHDFLSEIFSSYGEIDYVSIPRFKHSKMNKGFAFIEFKEPESVEKAVTAFKGLGNHLLDKIEPAQLCSIKTFNEEKEMEQAGHFGTHKKFDEDENPSENDDNNQRTENENCEVGTEGDEEVKEEGKQEKEKKKRKAKLETESDVGNENSIEEEVKEEGKLDKKKRKAKLETESDVGNQNSIEEELKEEGKPDKKKRKAKLETESDVGNENSIEEEVKEGGKPDKKKRRAKLETECDVGNENSIEEEVKEEGKPDKKKRRAKLETECDVGNQNSIEEEVKEEGKLDKKKRKAKLETESDVGNANSIEEEVKEEGKPDKKKRKAKLETESDVGNENSIEEELKEEGKPDKKKRKAKLETESDVGNGNSIEEEVKEEGKPDKKKRKVKLETESEDEPKAKKTKTESTDSVSIPSKSKRKSSCGSDQETGSETEKKKHRKEESCDDQPTTKKKKKKKRESESENENGKKEKKKRGFSEGDEGADNVEMKKCDDDTEKIIGKEKDVSPKEEIPEEDDNAVPESSNNEDEAGDYDEDRKKRHRKRKKSRKEKVTSGLQILTKKEWKVMRNRYLTEQRKRMSNLKKHLKQKQWEFYSRTKEEPMQDTDSLETKQEESAQNEKSSDAKVSYQAGVIVKIVMDEPIVDKDSFKTELKKKPEIKYIDVKECSNIVHLRFATSEAAQQFVQDSSWQGTTLIEGSEEQDYWDKVWKDRENKINKNIRKPKNGRKKLLEKAENMRAMHIRFELDDSHSLG